MLKKIQIKITEYFQKKMIEFFEKKKKKLSKTESLLYRHLSFKDNINTDEYIDYLILKYGGIFLIVLILLILLK